MDRSLDSIGSCSLDVDADSSDISDTSGSLNFPTPLSIKDITREFTSNIHDRCALRTTTIEQKTFNTTAYVHPASGKVCMVLTEPSTGADADAETVKASKSQQSVDVDVSTYDKKPSYLNLACCVNGYSNLTTYDSKIRRDINKSREVSPIRPSTSSLQYCKKNNSLAAPVLLTMPNVGLNTVPTPLTKQPASENAKYTLIESNNNNAMHHLENGDASEHLNGASDIKRGINPTSFIQQRVERLYGPGALAQGFYSPKKHLSPRSSKHSLDVENQKNSTELARKFQQVSPSKDYSEFRKKLDNNTTNAAAVRQASADSVTDCDAVITNGDVDLPVFRHLSQEFRAQLPTVSPKRSALRISPIKELPATTNGNTTSAAEDVVDHKVIKSPVSEMPNVGSEQYLTTTKIIVNGSATEMTPADVIQLKDGNYFLTILKTEQTRLLALAAVAEKYIDALTNNPEISEDTFGLLRSAAGKARLLVSQKMKQFEGLCHNNLNRSPEDKFPTTIDDLQGFWDMVNLQVDHVDSIFADIEKLRSNDWKRINEPVEVISIKTKSQKTVKTGNAKQKSSTVNVNSSKSDAAKSAAALKREAQRKQLMEMRRKHREAMTAANTVGVEDQSNVASAVTVGDSLTGDIQKIAVENSS